MSAMRAQHTPVWTRVPTLQLLCVWMHVFQCMLCLHACMCAFTREQEWRRMRRRRGGRGGWSVCGGGGGGGGGCAGGVGGCTFKFCDICSLQLECVYFYTASHKQRARLAPLVNVPTRYDGRANEIFTGRQKEWGEERGQRERKREKW